MTKQLIMLTIFLVSCGQTPVKEKQDQPTETIHVDNSVITVLPFDTTQYWFFKSHKPTELTHDDLSKIERILIKCINDYNVEQEKQFKEMVNQHPKYPFDKKNFIIDLSRYKRQYVATMNPKGEKEVWINCFCNAWNKDWKTNLIMVNDGGNCYFNLKVNLTTEQYYELMVNGDA